MTDEKRGGKIFLIVFVIVLIFILGLSFISGQGIVASTIWSIYRAVSNVDMGNYSIYNISELNASVNVYVNGNAVCVQNGTCILQNLSVIGSYLNVTVTNVYINATFIDGLNDSINALTYWNRSGTTIHPTNLSDNVGIGTTNPLTPLEVNGNLTANTTHIRGIGAVNRPTIYTDYTGFFGTKNSVGTNGRFLGIVGSDGYIGDMDGIATGNVYIRQGGNNRITISSTGAVSTSGTLTANGVINANVGINEFGTNTKEDGLDTVYEGDYTYDATAGGSINFQGTGTNSYLFSNGLTSYGNVGIGTANPTVPLTVHGDALFTDEADEVPFNVTLECFGTGECVYSIHNTEENWWMSFGMNPSGVGLIEASSGQIVTPNNFYITDGFAGLRIGDYSQYDLSGVYSIYHNQDLDFEIQHGVVTYFYTPAVVVNKGNFTVNGLGDFTGKITSGGKAVCLNDSTNCQSSADGTGGWTNSSIDTNTSLNVYINDQKPCLQNGTNCPNSIHIGENVELYADVAQTIPHATFTAINWTGEIYDQLGMHVDNSSELIVPYNGSYVISAAERWEACSSAKFGKLTVDGTQRGISGSDNQVNTNSFSYASGSIYMTEGQVLEFKVAQYSGSNCNTRSLQTWNKITVTYLGGS